MKGIVIEPYIDKYTGEFHRAGEAVDETEKRMKELAGFVKAVEAPAKKKQK